jgi:hypothetical protein
MPTAVKTRKPTSGAKAKPIISAKIVLNDDSNEMLTLMFQRAKVTPSDLLESAVSRFVAYNMDLLSPPEQAKFKKKQLI